MRARRASSTGSWSSRIRPRAQRQGRGRSAGFAAKPAAVAVPRRLLSPHLAPVHGPIVAGVRAGLAIARIVRSILLQADTPLPRSSVIVGRCRKREWSDEAGPYSCGAGLRRRSRCASIGCRRAEAPQLGIHGRDRRAQAPIQASPGKAEARAVLCWLLALLLGVSLRGEVPVPLLRP